MNLFELVEILQRVRGVDRKIETEHTRETKGHRNVSLVHEQSKERNKENKRRMSSSEWWRGSSSGADGESTLRAFWEPSLSPGATKAF